MTIVAASKDRIKPEKQAESVFPFDKRKMKDNQGQSGGWLNHL